MNKGLVIGKFMPPHLGHLRLIDFAAQHSDQLLVAVCSRPKEPISGSLRFRWMKGILGSYKNIKAVQIEADLPQDKEPSRAASKIWSRYLLKRFGRINTIFSSEAYGDYLAEYMQADHQLYDIKRKKEKISATQIRKDPLKYWNYIPQIVRPYFVKKICLYGPESTGKSRLARELADYYQTLWVPEFARDYIFKKGNHFDFEDMKKVGIGHFRSVNDSLKKANKLLFIDTDLITTLIYSRHYFGQCPAIIQKLADEMRYDLYLFCDIDLPWQADPQRDLAGRREEFKQIFKSELEKRKIPFILISGQGRERFKAAVKAVNNFLGLSDNQTEELKNSEKLLFKKFCSRLVYNLH
jgi:HTH-type transcriptional repressor of NAD biosynthesis genes